MSVSVLAVPKVLQRARRPSATTANARTTEARGGDSNGATPIAGWFVSWKTPWNLDDWGYSYFKTLPIVFGFLFFAVLASLHFCSFASVPFYCFFFYFAVMRFCCWVSSCSFVFCLLSSPSLCFPFPFALSYIVYILHETLENPRFLDETQRHPNKNPKWNQKWHPKGTPNQNRRKAWMTWNDTLRKHELKPYMKPYLKP